MREAAKKFEFERAAALRDRIRTLKQRDISGFFSAASEPAMAEPMTGAKSSVPAPPPEP
jgi:excinuclease UvrABC nuclease subunit